MQKLAIMIFPLLTATGCGAQLCAQQRVTLWPPNEPISEVVSYLEMHTCDFIDIVETKDPDVWVRYDRREGDRWCHGGGASEGRISILDPKCGIGENLTRGVALHELLHVLGHWHHDPEPLNVMHPTIHKGWYLDSEDVQFVIDRYCTVTCQ